MTKTESRYHIPAFVFTPQYKAELTFSLAKLWGHFHSKDNEDIKCAYHAPKALTPSSTILVPHHLSSGACMKVMLLWDQQGRDILSA